MSLPSQARLRTCSLPEVLTAQLQLFWHLHNLTHPSQGLFPYVPYFERFYLDRYTPGFQTYDLCGAFVRDISIYWLKQRRWKSPTEDIIDGVGLCIHANAASTIYVVLFGGFGVHALWQHEPSAIPSLCIELSIEGDIRLKWKSRGTNGIRMMSLLKKCISVGVFI